MVSIGHYVLADSRTEDTLLQLARILLHGLERHAVKGSPEDIAYLHQSLQGVHETLGRRTTPDELFAQANTAMDALKLYNERAVADLELKVKLLTDAIASVSSTSHENIRRLQQIKSQMSTSLGVKEIRSLRMLLSECVDGVLAEAEQQRAKTDKAGEQLNRTQRPSPPDPPAAIDPTTGFEIRVRAEEVFAQACQDECTVFAVVMVINQIQNVNRTLGREVGDAMLQRFATFMREHLPAVDQLFRWSGPTVVAMMRRRSMLAVRAAIEPLIAQRLSIKGPSDVQVPITTRWTVLPLMQPSQVLFQKIDSFADAEERSS